jgi:rubrerythrin
MNQEDQRERRNMATAARPAGLSVFESELLDHMEEHLDSERELLDAYKDAVEASGAEYVAYLFRLIIEDEARHHRLFEELANALRAPVERGVGARVPLIEPVANTRELLEATERLLDAEQRDARELRRLARTKGLRTMRGLSLWPLLIELMEHDTEKHEAILRFVRTQLRSDPGTRNE